MHRVKQWRAGLVLAILAAAGCARAARPPQGPAPEYMQLGPLELSATVERDMADVYGMIEIMNTGQGPIRIEYVGACAVAILILDEQHGAPPRWEEDRWWAGYPDICQASPIQLEIPGNTLARIVAPVVQEADIRGDSLPAGRYGSAVRLRLLQPRDTTIVLRSGPIELGDLGPGRVLRALDAGPSVDRRPPPPPLTSDRSLPWTWTSFATSDID